MKFKEKLLEQLHKHASSNPYNRLVYEMFISLFKDLEGSPEHMIDAIQYIFSTYFYDNSENPLSLEKICLELDLNIKNLRQAFLQYLYELSNVKPVLFNFITNSL
ncbi:MAG: hypothetical protein QXG39_02830 [Candidatus Aenigmatarchaeota archaeon]